MNTNETIRSFDFKQSNPIEIEVLDLNVLQKHSSVFEGHNRASFLQLVWVSSGELRIDVDFMPINLFAGEVFLISINQVYRFHTESECKGKLIIFTNEFFNHSELDNYLLHWTEFFNPIYLSPKISIDEKFMSPFIELMDLQISRRKDFYQPYIVQSFLRILLLEIERSLKETPGECQEHQDMRIGRRFCEAVGKGFKENRSINHYHKLLGVSEKALAKEVKEFTSKTPKEYIEARIIIEAKRLLAYGKNMSIKEVGIELGFDEPTNFNKFFKKHTGVTPNNFKIQKHTVSQDISYEKIGSLA